MSPAIELGGYGITAAANFDGSEIAVSDANGLNMYDGNLNLLGPLPGGGIGPPLFGGLLFSPDDSTLYEESMPTDIPVIYTISAHALGVRKTFVVRGLAPAMDFTPASISDMSPPFYIPTPFAVDSTGMLLGIQYWGIAFDDSTDFQNYYANQPGTPTFMQHMSPYVGPVSGGTASSGFGNAVLTTPNVWYGTNAGTTNVADGETLTITSPPAPAPGPVNVKFVFPDGTEVFNSAVLYLRNGSRIRRVVGRFSQRKRAGSH